MNISWKEPGKDKRAIPLPTELREAMLVIVSQTFRIMNNCQARSIDRNCSLLRVFLNMRILSIKCILFCNRAETYINKYS